MPSSLDTLYELVAGPAGPQEIDRRRYVQAFLTAKPTSSLPAEAWPLLTELWQAENQHKPCTDIRELSLIELPDAPRAHFSLWRGDITRLAAGAIVNAANSGLTGCYQPFHACVDNAIHTASGPWLRRACEAIMEERGRPEPTGTATATPGFFLPAKYVLHTVGPIVPDHRRTPLQETQLADCYRNCIKLAAELEVGNVAFCSISTGVFGYPKQAAAELSLRVITDSLHALGERAPHVVVVAYTGGDEEVYRSALNNLERGTR